MAYTSILDEIKNWKPLSTMEDADETVYKERILKAYHARA